MNLNEALNILKEHGFITEASNEMITIPGRIKNDVLIMAARRIGISKAEVAEFINSNEKVQQGLSYICLHTRDMNNPEAYVDALEKYWNELIYMGEAAEPGYMHGDISAWDREKINKGQTPRWAKKVTEIGPRKKELRQSSSYSEIAMRSVNTPDGKVKKPYTESDWRRDKENAKAMNQRIADAVADLLSKFEPFDHTDANQEYASIYVKAKDGQLDEYRVYGRMRGYMVKFIGHESVFSRKSEAVENINAVAIYIRNGGEI